MKHKFIVMLLIAVLAFGLFANLVANNRADKNRDQSMVCTPKE